MCPPGNGELAPFHEEGWVVVGGIGEFAYGVGKVQGCGEVGEGVVAGELRSVLFVADVPVGKQALEVGGFCFSEGRGLLAVVG